MEDVSLVDRWIQNRRARGRIRSEHTERAYRADLRAWARALGHADADAPDPATLSKAGLEMALTSWSATTADVTRQRRVATMTSWVRWLLDVGELDSSPIPRDFTVRTAPRQHPVELTQPELDAIVLAVTSPPATRRAAWPMLDRALLAVMLDGLLRAGDAASLRCGDWDRSGRDEALRVVGKGDKERWVPLTAEAAERLRRWDDARSERHGDPAPSDPLFVDLAGVALTSGKITARVGRWFDDAGVARPGGSLAHAFRHTGASRYERAGMALSELQRLLGHSSLATTSRYLRASGSAVAASVAAMPSPSARPEPSIDLRQVDADLDEAAGAAARREATARLEAATAGDPELQKALAVLLG